MSALLDALSYIGDSLDKPGRAVRGTLAGRPDELLAAIPFSDTLGWTDPSRAVSGRELLAQQGWQTGNDTLDAGLGFAADMALDPTTYLGVGGVGRLAKAGAKAAGAADDAGRVGLKGLRDEFGMMSKKPDGSFKAVGRDYFGDMPIEDVQGILQDKLALQKRYGFDGIYDTVKDVGVSLNQTPGMNATRRHETMHGLIDQARKQGSPGSVPGVIGRTAARLPNPDDDAASPLLRGLSLMLDETAGHASEARGTLGQLGSIYDFYTSPGKLAPYGRMIGEISPDAASIYRNLRYAPGAAGIGAAAGLGLSEIV